MNKSKRIHQIVIEAPGQPCGHKDCLAHPTHPCKRCGRIGGIVLDEYEGYELVKFIGGPKDGQTIAVAKLLDEIYFNGNLAYNTTVHFDTGQRIKLPGCDTYHLKWDLTGEPYYQY